MSEELLIPRKSCTRTHKTGNTCPISIINNGPDLRPNESCLKTTARKVPVLYYLSRNGHLDHPHLIDVPLSSPHGLYLKDVMNTLNCYRGKGTANMYSWSFKRSYKNGYVWHDASENDLIQPSNSHDYVLKGSEILQTHETQTEPENVIVRRNQSWSSFDNPHEHLVAKCESNRELAVKFLPEEATMPSNSSSEDMGAVNEDEHGCSGRMRVSRTLLQLITCGAESVTNVSPLVKSV